MMQIQLPYGKQTLPLALPKDRVNGVLASGIETYTPALPPGELVRQALENPVGC